MKRKMLWLDKMKMELCLLHVISSAFENEDKCANKNIMDNLEIYNNEYIQSKSSSEPLQDRPLQKIQPAQIQHHEIHVTKHEFI